MEQLTQEIEQRRQSLPADVKSLLENNVIQACSKYPFNKFTNIFSVMFGKGCISLEEYNSVRDAYFNRNPHLDIFEMSPRAFGQNWGEHWLVSQKEELSIPPKIKGYKPEFDLWLATNETDGIRVEVKSSRVVDDKNTTEVINNPDFPRDKTLIEKAFKKPASYDLIEELSFEMNFQQLKPSCCDVFIWIAVWLDDIDIWVIPSSKITMRPSGVPRMKQTDSIVHQDGTLYMGTQHQGGKGGDVPEGQIFVTNTHFKDLDCYKVTLDNIIQKIIEYGNSN